MIFFNPTEVLTAECTAIFEAFCGTDKLGECRLLVDGNTGDVFFLAYDIESPEIGEGLLKSAYNYAANRGAYIGTLSAKDSGKAHTYLNFECKNGVYANDIPTLLAGHCSCNDI